MNIKDLVQPGKTVHFVCYKQKEFWYETDCGFSFPVPLSDTEEGVFLANDKAMLFMRYIRKQLASIEEGKQKQQ